MGVTNGDTVVGCATSVEGVVGRLDQEWWARVGGWLERGICSREGGEKVPDTFVSQTGQAFGVDLFRQGGEDGTRASERRGGDAFVRDNDFAGRVPSEDAVNRDGGRREPALREDRTGETPVAPARKRGGRIRHYLSRFVFLLPFLAGGYFLLHGLAPRADELTAAVAKPESGPAAGAMLSPRSGVSMPSLTTGAAAVPSLTKPIEQIALGE